MSVKLISHVYQYGVYNIIRLILEPSSFCCMYGKNVKVFNGGHISELSMAMFVVSPVKCKIPQMYRVGCTRLFSVAILVRWSFPVCALLDYIFPD